MIAPRKALFMTSMTVIGCGYLGAVHAACMAELGHDVVGIDVDAAKVDAARRGERRSTSPGFAELLAEALATGRLRFIRRHRRRARRARCTSSASVPRRSGASTPPTCATSTRRSRRCSASVGRRLVVGKSTVPVGTAARLADLVEPKPGAMLAWNPEFLREGFAVEDTLHPDRLVYGLPAGADGDAARARCWTRSTRRSLAAGTPLVDHRLRHRRTGQGRGQLVPGHQDLLHQRDGRGLRGQRRRRHQLADAIGHDARIGRKFLNAGLGLRRRLPAQGHPRVHGPGR